MNQQRRVLFSMSKGFELIKP